MDEDQIEIKNELIDEHEELQIKDELNDQGFILPAIENTNLGNCDKIIQRAELNPKQFVKSESITIHSYSNSNGVPSEKLINLPSKNVQEKKTEKSEVNSQKLIKTFLQTDQGMVLIGKSTLPDLLTPATSNQTSAKTLIQMKTEPETVAESEIFVKSETDIKPEIFIGNTESDLSQELSNLSDDPLRIIDHGIKESNKQVYKTKQSFQCPFCHSKFYHKDEFNIHLSMVHGEKGIYLVEELQCLLCPSKFSDRGEIDRHF